MIIIFSNKALLKYLQDTILSKALQDDYTVTVDNDGRFSIDSENYVWGEASKYYHRDDSVKCTVSFTQLQKLIQLCDLLDEQPISLRFNNDNNFIGIAEANI